MTLPGLTDEVLEKAFQLAYCIHFDKETALQIVKAALEKLEIADFKQYKRIYYEPCGPRRKLSMPRPLLLQQLIYVESEPYERRKEESVDAPPDQATMLRHFVKHLAHAADGEVTGALVEAVSLATT